MIRNFHVAEQISHSYQIWQGLMLHEDYRLRLMAVVHGRALLNNFNSEKLETCHLCCLDHRPKNFSSSDLSKSLNWCFEPGGWTEIWGNSGGRVGNKVHGVTFTLLAGWLAVTKCRHHKEMEQILWRKVKKNSSIRVIPLFTSFTLDLCRCKYLKIQKLSLFATNHVNHQTEMAKKYDTYNESWLCELK